MTQQQDAILQDLTETQNSLLSTIDQLIARGRKLDELGRMSELLTRESSRFRVQTTRLDRRKRMLVIAAAVVLILFSVVLVLAFLFMQSGRRGGQ